MNIITITPGSATRLSNFLVKDYGWKKLTLTRKEASLLVNQKHSEGMGLSEVRNQSTGTIYLGKAFDSANPEGKEFKRMTLKTGKAWDTVLYFQPSAEDFQNMVIEISDKPRPRKPTPVTV